jgi:hypothetical protein
MLVAAVMTAAMTALAAPQTQPQQTQSRTGTVPAPPVQATVQKHTAQKKVEIFTPLSKKSEPKQTDKIERVDGMSSQPWFRMIGPQPGWSAFPDPERQDPTLNVFWIGAAPTR